MNELVDPCMGSRAAPGRAPLGRSARPSRTRGAALALRPRSDLSALNVESRAAVPVSPLLRRAVRAALRRERTDGLADPTLLGAVEATGYADAGRRRARPARAALGAAPTRRTPPPGRRWREISVARR